MAIKDSFSPDEWNQLLQSPQMVSLAVAASSPSGPLGAVQEMWAAGKLLARVKTGGSSNEIITAIVDDISTADGRSRAQEGVRDLFKGLTAEQVRTKAIDSVKAVGGLVDLKVGGALAADFKQWLGSVSQSVAEAATEGGFLGFGGTAVSDAEKATLKDISMALGLS
jgi:hypothetical protein